MCETNYFGNSVPPLYQVTLNMDEAFRSLRRDIIQPFPSPDENSDYLELWLQAEENSRPICEHIVEQWARTKVLHAIDQDDAAYFMIRRFDTAVEFVKDLFLDDLTTIFSHEGTSTDDVLRWVLNDWWYAHGYRIASWDDLVADEERLMPRRTASYFEQDTKMLPNKTAHTNPLPPRSRDL